MACKSYQGVRARTGVPVAVPLAGHGGFVASVAFSPGGGRIASGSLDGTLRIWDAETGVCVSEPLDRNEICILCVTISRKGNRIISGSGDGLVHIWDVEIENIVLEPLTGHIGPVMSVAS
jgi:WD40 repeat protein